MTVSVPRDEDGRIPSGLLGGLESNVTTTGLVEERFAVEAPFWGTPIGELPECDSDDIEAAFERAEQGQTAWEDRAVEERAAVLKRYHDLVIDHSDELLDIVQLESGKARRHAYEEILDVAITSRYYAYRAEAFLESETREGMIPGITESEVHHHPVGTVGIISPWNYPLTLAVSDAIPALLAGNSVVLKPSSETPITGGLLIAKLFELAGLPDGVLNVVTGPGSTVGDRVAAHPDGDVVAFTGSTGAGRFVGKNAVDHFALPALELGGNNPHVVLEDADLDRAVDAGTFGSFWHQGQVCISINRHLVHEDVYDEYVDLLVEHAESLVMGDPSADEEVTFGPGQNETQRDDLLAFVEESVEQGAVVKTGGEADGLFVEPTVLSNCTNDMPTACNEHFGPIAPVVPFSDDEEAIELANATEYGLSSSVHCEDLDRARDIADRIEAGMVHVNDQPINEEQNAPFGGVKDSGLGRYHAERITRELTEPKWISVQHDDRDYMIF
jgi:aldehyde dehydrogenase (NAD+)